MIHLPTTSTSPSCLCHRPWNRSAALVVLPFSFCTTSLLSMIGSNLLHCICIPENHCILFEKQKSIFTRTSMNASLSIPCCTAKNQLPQVASVPLLFCTYALPLRALPLSTISSINLLNSCLSSIGTTCPWPSKKALRTPLSSPPNPFSNIFA